MDANGSGALEVFFFKKMTCVTNDAEKPILKYTELGISFDNSVFYHNRIKVYVYLKRFRAACFNDERSCNYQITKLKATTESRVYSKLVKVEVS
jgi:hypothetical protein